MSKIISTLSKMWLKVVKQPLRKLLILTRLTGIDVTVVV